MLAVTMLAGAVPRTSKRVITIAHAAVTMQLVDTEPAGPSIGDLRTLWVALTAPGKTAEIGSLLSVAMDKPAVGQEIRTSNLVFVDRAPDQPARRRWQCGVFAERPHRRNENSCDPPGDRGLRRLRRSTRRLHDDPVWKQFLDAHLHRHDQLAINA